MGKRSVRENKNIYQLSREAKGLTREAASSVLEYMSPERIEKIESGKSLAHPDEILTMQQGYANPELANWYCTHECPIGMKYVPQASLKELPQLTIDLIAALNSLQEQKDRLISISVDGRVDDLERGDFDGIMEKLNSIDRTIQGMKIWLNHAAEAGKLAEPGK